MTGQSPAECRDKSLETLGALEPGTRMGAEFSEVLRAEVAHYLALPPARPDILHKLGLQKGQRSRAYGGRNSRRTLPRRKRVPADLDRLQAALENKPSAVLMSLTCLAESDDPAGMDCARDQLEAHL